MATPGTPLPSGILLFITSQVSGGVRERSTKHVSTVSMLKGTENHLMWPARGRLPLLRAIKLVDISCLGTAQQHPQALRPTYSSAERLYTEAPRTGK